MEALPNALLCALVSLWLVARTDECERAWRIVADWQRYYVVRMRQLSLRCQRLLASQDKQRDWDDSRLITRMITRPYPKKPEDW